MLWLKSLMNVPPGEFKYEIGGHIEQTPLIGELAARLVDFRKGNSLPRASRNEALEDIIVFTVARIRGDPEYCFETELSAGALLPQSIAGGCGGCGAQIG